MHERVDRRGLLAEDAGGRGFLREAATRVLGGTEEVGRKLLAAAVQRGETDFSGVRGIKRVLLMQIETATTAEPLRIVRRDPAPHGFVKYLFELHDGARVAAVRLPIPW